MFSSDYLDTSATQVGISLASLAKYWLVKKYQLSTSELRVRLASCETGLNPPVKYYYWPFQGDASLGIIYNNSFLFCYAFVRVCLLMPCGHLHGQDWPLGSCVWCLKVKLSLSNWYPGSGVVLHCIASWSLTLFRILFHQWFVSQWFDWHLQGCRGFTVHCPTERLELHWLFPTTRQSVP